MSEVSGESPAVPSLAEFQRFVRLSMQVCPNCSTEIGEGMCCMTYTKWHCWGCGARLDSRVVSPRNVMRCDNEWPDYTPRLGESRHPLACSCTGRGWYEWGASEAPVTARSTAVESCD